MRHRWRPWVGMVGLGLLAACGGGDDTAANADNKPVVLGEAITILSSRQANEVQLEDDRLIFPVANNDALLSLKVPSTIASDRSLNGGSKSNAYGFLRRVAGVEPLADTIVVHTKPTTMADIVQSGSIKINLEPDYDLLNAPQIKSLYHPQDNNPGNGPLVQKTVDIDLPSTTLKIPIHGKTVDVKLSGKLTLENARIDFRPSFDIGLDIQWFSVKEFHAIAKGKFDAGVTARLSATAAWDKSLTDSDPTDEVEKAITDAVQDASTLTRSVPLLSGSIPLPTWFVGPVPVVTDLNMQVDLDCGVAAEGSVELAVGADVSSTISAGFRWKDGKASTIATQSFLAGFTGPDLTVKGGASVTCALKPSIQLRFYGAIGPYLYVEVSDTVRADFKSECVANQSQPNCSASLKHTLGVSGGVGAKVDINVLGVGFEKDLGEMPLFDWSREFPLWDSGSSPCSLGTCQSTSPPADAGPPADGGTSQVCTPGATRCNTAATSVETCKADGSGWSSTMSCVGSCASGTCSTCTPKWTCAAWSVCGCTNKKTRTCTDSNSCGSTAGKPSISMTCDPCVGYPSGGVACGATSQFPNGCGGDLYTCGASGTTASKVDCQYGCHLAPVGTPDYCNTSGACTPGTTQVCYVTSPNLCGSGFDGYCPGKQTCTSTGSWGNCTKTSGPCMC